MATQQRERWPFYMHAGRLVAGSVHTMMTKDRDGKPREKPAYFFAAAVPKGSIDANGVPIEATVQNIINVTLSWLQGNPALALAQCGLEPREGFPDADFSWKLHDGDGKKWGGREGCANSWIFCFGTTTNFVVGDGNNQPIDPRTIELGFWIDVAADITLNGDSRQPGIFMSPQGVRLLGRDKIIVPGISLAQAFGGQSSKLPAGVGQAPLAPAGYPSAPQPPVPAAPAGYPAGLVAAPTGPGGQPQYAPAAPQPGNFAPAPQYAPVAPAVSGGNAFSQFNTGGAPGAGGGAPTNPAPTPTGQPATAYPFNPNLNFGR